METFSWLSDLDKKCLFMVSVLHSLIEGASVPFFFLHSPVSTEAIDNPDYFSPVEPECTAILPVDPAPPW